MASCGGAGGTLLLEVIASCLSKIVLLGALNIIMENSGVFRGKRVGGGMLLELKVSCLSKMVLYRL